MECEVCGSPAEKRAIIEGAILVVCESCAKLGQEVKNIKVKPVAEDIIILAEKDVARDYPARIKAARNALGLTRAELAKKIFEKESVIRRIERGELIPDTGLVKKLEKVLNVELLVKIEEQRKRGKLGRAKKVTIGDVVEIE